MAPRIAPEDYFDDVGPGWRGILERLVAKLRALGWDEDVHQCKEKYGGIRVYVGATTKEMEAAIDEAEAESFKTCEQCGAPGQLRRLSWLRTLCEDCLAAWITEGGA